MVRLVESKSYVGHPPRIYDDAGMARRSEKVHSRVDVPFASIRVRIDRRKQSGVDAARIGRADTRHNLLAGTKVPTAKEPKILQNGLLGQCMLVIYSLDS